MQQVTLLGTGLMGAPMSRRLLAAGFALTVWNRTAAKALALQADGARVAGTAAEAVAAADVVITMLEHGPATEAVWFGSPAAGALRPGTLVIDMASILPREARDHAQRLAARGAAYVDAPVSGGTLGAQAGTLAIMNELHVPAGLLVNVLLWHRDTDLQRLALGGAVILLSLWLNSQGRRPRPSAPHQK